MANCSGVSCPIDLNLDNVLSIFLRTRLKSSPLCTEKVLQSLNGGKPDLGILASEKVKIPLVATSPNFAVPALNAFAILGITTGSNATNFDTGLTINASAVFAPIPNAVLPVYKPNLAPRLNAFPASGIPPPIIAPSCANFNLLINLATDKSLPDLPSSLTLFTKNVSLSELDTVKSVIPNANAPVPTFFVTPAVPAKILGSFLIVLSIA